MTVKITSRFLDQKGNDLNIKKMNKPEEKNDTTDEQKIDVIFAHSEIINTNGLLLHDDSIETTREKYPLHFEHSDNRIEDVIGYMETDGKVNSNGEFTGKMSFYNTEQGTHAKELWNDGVIDELSIAYYVTDFDWLQDEEDNYYMAVNNALLKEVSLVSVGADRDTGEIEKPDDDPKDDSKDDPKDDLNKSSHHQPEPPKTEEPKNNSTDTLLETKRELLKDLYSL